MADRVVVVGLGQFGTALVNELAALGYDVLVIERRGDRTKEIGDERVQAIQGDATSKALWEDLGLKDYRAAVVAFSSNLEGNILTALHLKKLGIPHLVAKSNGGYHTEVLRAIGVDVVVEPQEETGRRLAHVLGSYIEDYIDLSEDYGITKAVAPPMLVGLTCQEAEQKRQATVLALRRGDRVILSPSPAETIQANDVLVLAGRDSSLRKLAVGPLVARPQLDGRR
jgi:trk system potassium uptake protein TrkA